MRNLCGAQLQEAILGDAAGLQRLMEEVVQCRAEIALLREKADLLAVAEMQFEVSPGVSPLCGSNPCEFR